MRRFVPFCAALAVLAVASPAFATPPWERGVPPPVRDGSHLSLGAVGASTRWYFAEGHTGDNFEQYLVIYNPQHTPASVQVEILGTSLQAGMAVAPGARSTLNVNDLLPAGDGGIAVTADVGVVAERVQYFDFRGLTGGSSAIGVTAAATTWVFGEGYTGPGFDTFVLLANPGATPVEAVVTFQPEGAGPVTVPVLVDARGRVSINAADHVPGSSFTTRVVATGGLVAERAMYFAYGPTITGGHVAFGATEAHPRWHFAEGYTGEVDTWYLLGNPSPTQSADVVLTLHTGGGASIQHGVEVPPGARVTIKANDIVPAAEAWATVASINGVGIVAERATYIEKGLRNGGTATLGAPALSERWLFGEGYTSAGFETLVAVANPRESFSDAVVRLRRPDGSGTEVPLTVASRQRIVVRVNDLPGFDAADFGIEVTADQPVVAERITYFRYPAGTFDVGRLGTRVLSLGMSGPDVYEVQRRMLELGLDPGPLDGVFGELTEHAAIAIEKWLGLARQGDVGHEEKQFLAAGQRPFPRRPFGDRVEIDISRQVGLLVRDGEVQAWWSTSTGRSGFDTPRGTFHAYRKYLGWECCGPYGALYSPIYFIGGVAMHGYPSVPTFPASHGCTRTPMSIADWLYDTIPIGFEFYVYD